MKDLHEFYAKHSTTNLGSNLQLQDWTGKGFAKIRTSNFSDPWRLLISQTSNSPHPSVTPQRQPMVDKTETGWTDVLVVTSVHHVHPAPTPHTASRSVKSA